VRAALKSTVSFLGHLQLWHKLALLVAAMAIPAVLLGCFYFSRTTAGVHQAEDELRGARYLRALGALSGEILTHRGREHAFLSGDTARRADVISKEEDVDKLVAAVDPIDSELGSHFGSSQDWQAIKSEWAQLKSKGLQQTADENDVAHTALTSHLTRLAEDIGARSMTSFDPDEQTRQLVRVASDYAPSILLQSADMRRHAVRAASKGYLGGDDRMAIRVFHDRETALLATLTAAVERMPEESRAVVQPALQTAQSSVSDFYSVLQSKILNAANLEASAASIHDAGVPPNMALKQVSAASYDALTKSLEQRLSRLVRARNLTVAVTILAFALAFSLAVLINRSLSQPLTHAVTVFGRISSGHYDNQIEADGVDEAGLVLRALRDMQSKLRSQIETERAVAAENTRIRQALDKASTNIVLADAAHGIIYLNQAAQAIFAQGEPDIRKSLPGFEAHRLRGSSLERLSTEPARERHLLDTLTGADTQERPLGSHTFRTVSSPVVSDAGERIGTVMEWTDRTQEIAVEKEMQTMLTAVLGGDLAKRIELVGKTGFFAATSRGVNQLADNMAEVVSMVKSASGEVYRGSQEISAGNTNLQQRTEEQSGSLEETASSMEEMTTTVKQNADNAGQANQLAMAARDQAEQGGAVVGKAVHAMSDINDSARKIADIIGVIDEIAFQTNLLALNAAVEAARAGEQGRGFAVVASEVRTLAGRSATAAKEIKELIQDSVRKVADGSVLVTQSGQTLQQIVASVKKVSDIVAEIAAASREQSSGIAQVNRAVLQMDELTQQNAALVEQATTASQGMAREAQALHEMMGSYRLGHLERAAQTSDSQARAPRPAARPAPARAATRSETVAAAGRGKRVSAASYGPDAAATPDSLPAAASAGSDTEWQEF